MNITITFRHVDASEAIKRHATEKFRKLQKLLRQPMTAKVTLSVDKLLHVAESRLSSGGEHFEAREETEDMYASIDGVMEKLERQIRGTHGAAQSKKRRSGDSLRAGKPKALAPVGAKKAARIGKKKKKAKAATRSAVR